MKIKVCGMRALENIEKVAALQPDYMGFIFWEPSKRYFQGSIPALASEILRVGVFVDASVEDILEKAIQMPLDLIQLHGTESAHYCAQLREKLALQPKDNQKPIPNCQIIKAFSVGTSFDFDSLHAYEPYCDYFLFDTKGLLPGGNGSRFNWQLLSAYNSDIPFFLSGGIGPEDVPQLMEFLSSPMAQKCHAIDVNSKFEIRPGMKNTEDLQNFIKKIRKEN
ncbi:phosphoribosylanthranilate isomerase [Muriicola sp.]|uniref:phosphoribosylanthranilate isomerase n=1 Tax=Muriicola sp. TaxID=2020856 RepID=UPI003C77D78F